MEELLKMLLEMGEEMASEIEKEARIDCMKPAGTAETRVTMKGDGATLCAMAAAILVEVAEGVHPKDKPSQVDIILEIAQVAIEDILKEDADAN